MVMKGLFIAKQSTPDILPSTMVLSGRVKETTESECKLLRYLVKYVHATQDLDLIIDMHNFKSPQ